MKKLFFLVLALAVLTGCSKQPAAKAKEPILTTQDFIKRGEEQLAKHDLEGAVRTFKEATVHSPYDPKMHFMLGQVLFHARQYPAAIESLNQAVRLDPNDGHAYFLLGGCYDLLGDQQNAIVSLEKSAAIFRESRDAENFKRSAAALGVLVDAQKQDQKTP